MKATKIFYTVIVKTSKGSWEETFEHDTDLTGIARQVTGYATSFVYPGSEFISCQVYRSETHYFPIETGE